MTHKWINELRDKEEFAELLKERWKVLDQVLEELLKEGGVFDTWVIENEGSYASDSTKWQDFYKESDPEAGNDYVEYCNALKDWINAHRKWINENIDDIGRIGQGNDPQRCAGRENSQSGSVVFPVRRTGAGRSGRVCFRRLV